MFKRFYKTPALATVTTETHVVRDSQTKQVIARGTKEQCDAYRNAFGLAYVEAA